MGSVVPYFQRLQKEGEAGRKKITQITRYGTVFLATMQSYGVVAVFLPSLTDNGSSVVFNPGIVFTFTGIVSMVTGTLFLMWLGERITERGIGNGISLIIMVGIVAAFPTVINNEIILVQQGVRNLLSEFILIGIKFFIIEIFVEILDPPIIQVIGFLMLLVTFSKALTSASNWSPTYEGIYFVISHIEA